MTLPGKPLEPRALQVVLVDPEAPSRAQGIEIEVAARSITRRLRAKSRSQARTFGTLLGVVSIVVATMLAINLAE